MSVISLGLSPVGNNDDVLDQSRFWLTLLTPLFLMWWKTVDNYKGTWLVCLQSLFSLVWEQVKKSFIFMFIALYLAHCLTVDYFSQLMAIELLHLVSQSSGT